MSLNKLSVKDVELKGKQILMRVDFNVPQDKELKITNTGRIEAAIPTINYLFEKGASKVVLMSHLGRPSGKGFEAAFTLKPVAEALEKLLSQPVLFVEKTVGEEAEKAIKASTQKVVLLENVRFHSEEECKKEDDPAVKAFRAGLRKLGDIYVDDAFGTAHRAHSSMVGEGFEIKCSGLLLEKEISYLSKALENPERPYMSIVGGKKVSDKILLLKNLMPKCNKLIICGGMAYTFLKVQGKLEKLGKSIYDPEGAKIVPEILEEAKKYNVEVILPCDFVAGDDFSNSCNIKECTCEEGIPDNFESMDCGKKSQALFREKILECKTIIWNGPAGVSEFDNFANGTRTIAEACVEATEKHGAVSIIGGGDSATAAKKLGLTKKFSHVSTGGGATIELLEGKVLPGVARLTDKK